MGFFYINPPENCQKNLTSNLIQFQFFVALSMKYFISAKFLKHLNSPGLPLF